MPRMDITGQRFGRLLVAKFAYAYKGNTHWDCICGCGEERIIKGGSLSQGITVSCGCYHKEVTTTHGCARINKGQPRTDEYRTYAAYNSMIHRVKPNAPHAKDYYLRGIGIDDAR